MQRLQQALTIANNARSQASVEGPGAPELRRARGIRPRSSFSPLTVLMTWPQAVHLLGRPDRHLGRQAHVVDPAVGLPPDPARSVEPLPGSVLPPCEIRPRVFREPLWRGRLRLPASRCRGLDASELQRPSPARDVPVRAVGLGARALRDRRCARVADRRDRLRVSPVAPGQLPHIQFQWGGVPVPAVAVSPALPGIRARRDAVAFGVCFAWNALANVHYAPLLGDPRRHPSALVRRGPRGGRAAGCEEPFWQGAGGHSRSCLSRFRTRRLPDSMEWSATSARWRPSPAAGRTFCPPGKRIASMVRPRRRWSNAEGDFFPGSPVLGLAAAAAGRSDGPGGPRAARRFSATPRAARASTPSSPSSPGLARGAPGARAPALRPPLSRSRPSPGVPDVRSSLARLTLALPGRGRSANLRHLRRRPSPALVLLLVAIAPPARSSPSARTLPLLPFPLFNPSGWESSGAIRVPARGIVLFDLSLAVLAAWGLRGAPRRSGQGRGGVGRRRPRPPRRRVPRPFHSAVEPDDAAAAPPVYRWLAAPRGPRGAVVDWPLWDSSYDFDLRLRQAQHDRPIVNGYSGFFPWSRCPSSRTRLRSLIGPILI